MESSYDAPSKPVFSAFLFTSSGKRKKQADLPPEYWSITIENFLRFFEECKRTITWYELIILKGGEQYITMHDINTYFIIPWTQGTGSSIALLFDPNPGKVELMISHSWSGSVMETTHAIETLLTMHSLSKDTRIFFCTLSQYQAEDGAPGGLSIQEQLKLNPFSVVINARPKYGMCVVHTLLSEVYDRLWCVYEVAEALDAKLPITGLFDPHVWTLLTFQRLMKIETKNAKCSRKCDKKMLKKKIGKRDGFARLDRTIRSFRRKARKDLRILKKTFHGASRKSAYVLRTSKLLLSDNK